jgi:hypothetical protein
MRGRAEERSERAILDRCNLLSMTAALVLAVVPWLWGLCSLPVSNLAWTMAGFGFIYWAAATLLDHVERRMALRAGVVALQVVTLLTLSWAWHLAGGVLNTAFLWTFAPILLAQAILLRGWLPYGMAAVSWLAVGSIALAESDGLRLWAYRNGLPLVGFGELLRLRHDTPAFDGMPEVPSHSLVVLLLFGGFAFMVASTGRVLSRWGRIGPGAGARVADDGRAADLFRLVVESDPCPRVIVQPGSGAIVHMSASFRKQMLVDAAGANLFDVVKFAESADFHRLLAEEKAELERCRYGIGPENRIGRLRAHRVVQDRDPLVSLTFEETLVGLSGETRPPEPAKGGSA